MSKITLEQTLGRWRHSDGGRINISMDSDGRSVVILHPTMPKQTLDSSRFCSGSDLDYFGHLRPMLAAQKLRRELLPGELPTTANLQSVVVLTASRLSRPVTWFGVQESPAYGNSVVEQS
mmetsp:Transcript_49550/g.92799  ORF Transcript_49550/g.92799 Transcript_49550/m.92799 type:complete len:120 (+) Transcript_49550:109-468(+)